MKRIALRASARDDIEAIIRFYRREGGKTIAVDFTVALEKAYRSIGGRPSAASPYYSYALGLPGLRSKPVGKYPYLIFFIERSDQIDVWRILHAQRDIPRTLGTPGTS